MPIDVLTNQVNSFLEEELEKRKKAIVYNLCYVGEQALNAARLTNSYKDQTGNLRSSIGYIVAVDGEIVKISSFDVVKKGKNGKKCGKEYAMQLINNYPNGIVLIVVAGMNYAGYVSAKGYDVIDSAELLATKLVPQILSNLGI